MTDKWESRDYRVVPVRWHDRADPSTIWFRGDTPWQQLTQTAGRSRTRGQTMIPAAERKRRWAEVHASERGGKPIRNARGYAMFGEPARR